MDLFKNKNKTCLQLVSSYLQFVLISNHMFLTSSLFVGFYIWQPSRDNFSEILFSSNMLIIIYYIIR